MAKIEEVKKAAKCQMKAIKKAAKDHIKKIEEDFLVEEQRLMREMFVPDVDMPDKSASGSPMSIKQ